MKNNLNLVIMALNHLSGPNKRRARSILDEIYKEVKDINDIDFGEAILIGVKSGLFQKTQQIGIFIDAYDHALRALKKCKENNIKIINIYEENFPEVLKFKNGSYIYYYKGDLSLLNNQNRATVVGSRFPSEKGYEFAFDISKFLLESNYSIISGLAQGCDTAVHDAAIKIKKPSVAIAASNLASINPKKLRNLANQIVENNGLVMSEYSPLAITNASMFKTRDLIQAQISNMIFVSEFDSNSGTLQTIEFASSLNKPTFTLKSLLNNENFNGYESLRKKRIRINAYDWKQLEDYIINERSRR